VKAVCSVWKAAVTSHRPFEVFVNVTIYTKSVYLIVLFGTTVIVLSFGESEDEIGSERGRYLASIFCCFSGFVLVRKDDGSYRRIGVFHLHNEWSWRGKKEHLTKVFRMSRGRE
jgi:hypothetical protein